MDAPTAGSQRKTLPRPTGLSLSFAMILMAVGMVGCNPKESIPPDAQSKPGARHGDINYVPREDWNAHGQHAYLPGDQRQQPGTAPSNLPEIPGAGTDEDRGAKH